MHAFAGDEEGATMIEYALIAALISVAAITVLSPIGQKILAVFTDVLNALPN
ncbi:MAG: Flp family type IVb pilin [Phenylobacterium sp.]|nr:Flp family type IVb pilin [Phenylobacterium sp.]